MKYVPLDNRPNISRNRFKSVSPSLQLDDRDFPHVVWLDEKQGENEINYAFWDGLKWSYNGIPKIFLSEEDISFSPNSFVLDPDENPIVVFSRKSASGSTLSLASCSSSRDGWIFNDNDVDYDVGWVGVLRYDRDIALFPNSSSSSADSSSSSSSVSSSSSSGIDLESSVSSSSSQSLSTSSSSSSNSSSSNSSSSSIDSNSSSSSSSFDDGIFIVTAYDKTNSEFKVYAVNEMIWRLIGSLDATISDFSSLRMDLCGRKIGLAYVDSLIRYNFFDIDLLTSSFSSFATLSKSSLYGSIVDMDFAGFNVDDTGIMSFAWVSNTSDTFYVIGVTVSDDGSESSTGVLGDTVESSQIDVKVPQEYVVNGYRKIGVSLNRSNLSRVVVAGSSFKLFSLGEFISIWGQNKIDIENTASGVVPVSIQTVSNDVRFVIESDTGDIYYFEPDLEEESFPVSTPDMVLLNNQWAFHSEFSEGELTGENLLGIYDGCCADILKDSIKRVLVGSSVEDVPDVPVVATTTTTTLSGATTTTTTTSVSAVQKIISSDIDTNDLFGQSVSIDGSRLVVGVPGESAGGTSSGAAYVFDLSGGIWTQTQKLVASDADAGDTFGVSVSLNGDRLVVGAPSEDGAGTDRGAAYVFDLSGTWSETQKLTASDGASFDRFGTSASLDGDRLIVGANLASGGEGRVYVFDLSGTWSETQILAASDAAPADQFGFSTSLDGDRLIAGSHFEDGAGTARGAAYVFDLSGTWSETQKLTASDTTSLDRFGTSVSLDGDRIIVGSPAFVGDEGQAYVFDLSGTWSETQILTASDGSAGNDFGGVFTTISLDGTRLAIGASAGASGSGRVYIFDLSGTWSETQILDYPDGPSADAFSRAVSLSGDNVVVGASANSSQGAAYVFNLS